MKTLLLIFIFIYNLVEINGKLFSKISTNQKPREDPIDVIEVDRFPEKRCFSACQYNVKCLSLLIEKFSETDYQCRLYDKIHDELTLESHEGESTFHSMVFHEDCNGWKKDGAKTGVYSILLSNGSRIKARCNMDIEGGGWLVFQHRFDGSVIFNTRDWNEYKRGFGSVYGEHWLGNEILHMLTSKNKYEFYLHGGRFDGTTKYTRWDYFEIESETYNYRLKTGANKMSGDDSIAKNWGKAFTTHDNDNDNHSANCDSYSNRGGFWYDGNGGDCGELYLNAKYYYQEEGVALKGLIWRGWIEDTQSLKWTEFMIRKVVV